jgi:hypothetical protein
VTTRLRGREAKGAEDPAFATIRVSTSVRAARRRKEGEGQPAVVVVGSKENEWAEPESARAMASA